MGTNKPTDYYSFLLRLWRTGENDGEIWRATLENAHTGERCGFTSLEELLAYLSQLTTTNDDTAHKGM